MRQLAGTLLGSRKLRFLAVGGCNTASGYCVSAATFYLLSPHVHYFWILALATVVNMTVSYLSQKLLVFRTKGNWAVEYLRFYLVNSLPIALGFVLFPALVDGMHVNPYLAMALTLALNVVIGYVGHSRISFRPARPRPALAADAA